MSTRELEKQLEAAQERLKQVLRTRADLRDSLAAFEAVASAQRALAAAKGEEYAVPYDIGFVPEAAVSEPVLLQSDDAAILTFSAVRQTPDGKHEDAGYGIVELDLCSLTKFGYPNDEALPGHHSMSEDLAVTVFTRFVILHGSGPSPRRTVSRFHRLPTQHSGISRLRFTTALSSASRVDCACH